jgi:hypothetical protein
MAFDILNISSLKWTMVALQQALDNFKGLAIPVLKKAEEVLNTVYQEKRHTWADRRQFLVQNAVNLASQATRLLTISDWSGQDCEEFMEDIEKEFKKVQKALCGATSTTVM